MYKVFLVEDEIVTREGIRDNVNWRAAGFEFCGEAPDGEMALSLIETTHPDVLITDIKMPFMDGLQLSRIVRKRMPGVKIIILSGHDEFSYAQEAVKLGVTEYLLKPVSARDLQQALLAVARQLDDDRYAQENVEQLRAQLADNRQLVTEKFLLRLVTGDLTASEAIEESRRLGLDIIAAGYQVIVVKIEVCQQPEQADFQEYQYVRRLLAELVNHNADVFLIKKDLEELVLLLKGSNEHQLAQESLFLTKLIREQAAGRTRCILRVGTGRAQRRIGDIPLSLAEAMAALQQDSPLSRQPVPDNEADKAELLKLDKSALENFLRFGVPGDFETFFDAFLAPLSASARRSYLIKNYIFIDIVLTTAKFVHQLGGIVDEVIPEINAVETLLMNIKTVTQIREEARKIIASALAFRDALAGNSYTATLQQAREFIEQRYHQPDISLNEVAAHINLSPSHFSAVFSRETGETFKEYLTRVRIDKAKELLKTTNLKSFEISDQVGYADPHYFSVVFKKSTGMSPTQFKLHGQM
ncbi:MAG: Regulator of RpoS [Anaerolineae bacterium]|nr:Regulator of RpoS [Anaerolineae bacterium]